MYEATARMAEIQRLNDRVEADKTRAFRDQCAISAAGYLVARAVAQGIDLHDEVIATSAFHFADIMVAERAKRDAK